MIEIGPVGSPNFARFVLDGDQSEFSFPAPPNPSSDPGSATIEALFNDYFATSQLAIQSSNALFSAREFRLAGVPVGALHSGSDDLKTAQQAALFGGTAGVAFDPCFLVVCDGLANVSNTALDQMSDAAAHIVLTLSRRNFAQQPLVQN